MKDKWLIHFVEVLNICHLKWFLGILTDNYREGHSYGVDFYTLGALLYELVTGLPPFYSRDEEEIK